ncbi:MAG: N-acetylmuramoyl-L-alanine amidase [Oscillospiraceae bacterium]|nr:N-acetylmuramoyl-L-alanine amidase [Oscillospiraceae bacterium]
MKKERKGLYASILFIALLVGCVLISVLFLLQGRSSVDSAAEPSLSTLVIDPGHGGIDGGAVSDDGTRESDLNLAIALKLRLLAELVGQPVVMTRSDDQNRESYADYSEHEDLVRRTELINRTPGAVLISIHQNDFPTGQPSGSQVFYAATPGSEELGKRCHGNLISILDPTNRRVAAPAPRALYITSHVSCPAILAECGFMSNNFDVQKLCRRDYQVSLALILTGSLLQYFNEYDRI